jgi:hypothetical protein
MKELVEKLEYAKKATQSCLDSASTLVDMHDLEYWAGVVVRLRNEIKSKL